MSDIRQRVLDDILETMTQLAGDWEIDEPIVATTKLLADLGLESLDLVVLGINLQQRYGRLPFTELLAAIGARPVDQRDLSVGELVTFVVENRVEPAVGASR